MGRSQVSTGRPHGRRPGRNGVDSLILVVRHGCSRKVALLHVHAHAAILHVPHHLRVVLMLDIRPHLAKELLLLTLSQARLLLSSW